MSDDLSIHGSLEETTVPDLFRSLVRSRETAIISLEAAARHNTIFFENGAIVSAGSSDPDLGLATVLLRTGELSLRQFNEANEQMSSSKTMSAVLCEMGFLTPDELAFAQERKIANIVNDAVRFRSGTYAIDFVPELPAEVPRHRLETERLLMNGVEQIESWTLIGRGIGRMNEVLRQSEGSDAKIFALEVTEEEMHLYSILSEPQSIGMLCERSYLSNFETCRTVWAMWTVTLVEHGVATEVVQTRNETLEELELQATVEQYNTVFQSLFALVGNEVGDHIWDFMDRVIRHLAADRLPYLSGISLTNEARVDFDQLHNNLIASGLEDRATVANEVLSQLLYGWVVETRQEFGPRLQHRVDEVVRPLLEDQR
jgi:hypothetical protein